MDIVQKAVVRRIVRAERGTGSGPVFLFGQEADLQAAVNRIRPIPGLKLSETIVRGGFCLMVEAA